MMSNFVFKLKNKMQQQQLMRLQFNLQEAQPTIIMMILAALNKCIQQQQKTG